MPCYDPSTGAVIALAPHCTAEEVEAAMVTAAARVPGMARYPGEQARPGALQA